MRAKTWFQAVLMGVMAVGISGSVMADDVKPQTKVFKSWTFECATPAPAAGATTQPKPFCIVHHEIPSQNDKTKTLLIATSRYIGKDRKLAMILRLPPVTNLQKGVVFNIDTNPAYKAKIVSCTPQLCTSLFEITDDMLKQLRAGVIMNIEFAVTNGQPLVKLTLPLDGYATALDALKKTGL